ncbi:MAG TPA: hypothetical protein P5228_04535 [Bacteroidales bacterium]|nr:hypothetical protein [Bacteroidales bacterium]
MNRVLFLLPFLLTGLAVSGQYDYFTYENGRFQPDMHVYVFSDSCTLKTRPSVESNDIITLRQGDRLLVWNAEAAISERNGLIQYWYRVEYRTDSLATNGYISGNDLALGALNFQIDYRRDLLLFRITDYREAGPYTLTAKIVRDGKTLKTVRTPFIDYHLNTANPDYSFSVLKNIQAGIDEKSEVAEISYVHSQPEFPVGTLYLIWNGENLAVICETTYFIDPELIEFESYLIYPGREGVQPGTVKKVEILREFDEKSEGFLETERIETIFVWDGVSVRKK